MEPGELFSYLKSMGLSSYHTLHHRSYSDSALYSLCQLASSNSTGLMHPYSNDTIEGSSSRSSSRLSSPLARPNSYPRTPQSLSSSSSSSFYSDAADNDVVVDDDDDDGDEDGDEDDYDNDDDDDDDDDDDSDEDDDDDDSDEDDDDDDDDDSDEDEDDDDDDYGGYYGDDEEEVDETGEDGFGSASLLSDGESIESSMKRVWQESSTEFWQKFSALWNMHVEPRKKEEDDP